MLHNKLSKSFLLWLLLQSPVWANEEAIGYVKTVSPQAFLIVNQKSEPATVGSPIYTGTILKTDSNGSMGVSLKDNTVLSFGADTEFEVTGYIYQPSKEKLQLDMKLLKGTLQYISGVIAKLKPSAVKLDTPTGIIGVRGTRFVVKVED